MKLELHLPLGRTPAQKGAIETHERPRMILAIACAALFFTSCATTETATTLVPHGMGTC